MVRDRVLTYLGEKIESNIKKINILDKKKESNISIVHKLKSKIDLIRNKNSSIPVTNKFKINFKRRIRNKNKALTFILKQRLEEMGNENKAYYMNIQIFDLDDKLFID